MKINQINLFFDIISCNFETVTKSNNFCIVKKYNNKISYSVDKPLLFVYYIFLTI